MQKNSFHRLLDEEMNDVPPLSPEVKAKVQGSMTFLQLMGKALELYVPKALDTLLFALGSTDIGSAPPSPANSSQPDRPSDPDA